MSVTCKDQVVIHADVSDHKLVANEVHFGVMKGKQSMDRKVDQDVLLTI